MKHQSKGIVLPGKGVQLFLLFACCMYKQYCKHFQTISVYLDS